MDDGLTNFTARELIQEKPVLTRYARALLKYDQNVEDLVQQVMLRAIEKQHLFAKGTNLRGWLMTMMYNKHVSNARTEARRLPYNLHVGQSATEGHPDRSVQPDINVLIRDMTNGLALLPQKQLDVLRMVQFQGMNYEECAEALHIPVGTVRSRLNRAKRTLRNAL